MMAPEPVSGLASQPAPSTRPACPPPCPPLPADSLAGQGFLGSLSVLQLLAASLLQVQLGQGDGPLGEAMDRVGSVMRAVWGPACTSAASQRAQRERLDRRQWVPCFPPSPAPPGGAAPRPQRQGRQGQAPPTAGTSPLPAANENLRQHLREHCGLGSAAAALDAVWEVCLTLRLHAGSRLQSPSKPQAQQLLCDAQALLDRCPSAAATARHVTTAVKVAELAAAGSQWWGMDRERRQMVVKLLEETLSRAEAEKCEWKNGLMVLASMAGWPAWCFL